MPYAFAHPLAVIPLHRLLGRSSVPSALVIGSVIPDAWYFIPSLTRADSHSPHGLLLFCLPAGLVAYAAFHLLFKLPLLALLPPALAGRLRAWTVRGLPATSWPALLVSLAAGALTHLAWDAFTHDGAVSRAFPVLEMAVFDLAGYEVPLQQFLQHASTLLGAGFLAWWVSRKLRATVAPAYAGAIAGPARIALLALFFAVPLAVFAGVLLASPLSPAASGLGDLRRLARAGGVTALSMLGIFMAAYCVIWRFLQRRPARRRA